MDSRDRPMANDQWLTTGGPVVRHWSLVVRGEGDAETAHDLRDPGTAAEDPHHAPVPDRLPHRLLDPPADGGPGQAGQEDGRAGKRGLRPAPRPGEHLL